MFGMGLPEILVILAVALIVIGPKKLPDLARSLGRALGEFKRATSEMKASFNIDEEIKSVKQAYNHIDEASQRIADEAPKPGDNAGGRTPDIQLPAENVFPPVSGQDPTHE